MLLKIEIRAVGRDKMSLKIEIRAVGCVFLVKSEASEQSDVAKYRWEMKSEHSDMGFNRKVAKPSSRMGGFCRQETKYCRSGENLLSFFY